MFDILGNQIKSSTDLSSLGNVYSEIKDKQSRFIDKPASYARLEELILDIKAKAKTLNIGAKH